ncbi:four helix bundle protein [Roseivirga sp. E12]|uniref:four helix bundle protein n=1 Tax=Roseivirga sp. E12 TaxID=2819237 RepID=UPI001ABC3BEF|nr:four helix bundle protein [Roseivirga sp. E12]MBO3698752.1 four helix bundle protein [Roseivirga sp. E12]
MHNFKELKVWQKARIMVKEVYVVTAKLPKSEKFNLISQMQSCAVSVMSNIAEGAGRGTDTDFARFLDMALGSSYELESQLIVSADLSYLESSAFNEMTTKLSEVQRMIIGLMNKLRGQ